MAYKKKQNPFIVYGKILPGKFAEADKFAMEEQRRYMESLPKDSEELKNLKAFHAHQNS